MSDSNDAPNLELSDEGDDIQKQRYMFSTEEMVTLLVLKN